MSESASDSSNIGGPLLAQEYFAKGSPDQWDRMFGPDRRELKTENFGPTLSAD